MSLSNVKSSLSYAFLFIYSYSICPIIYLIVSSNKYKNKYVVLINQDHDITKLQFSIIYLVSLNLVSCYIPDLAKIYRFYTYSFSLSCDVLKHLVWYIQLLMYRFLIPVKSILGC